MRALSFGLVLVAAASACGGTASDSSGSRPSTDPSGSPTQPGSTLKTGTGNIDVFVPALKPNSAASGTASFLSGRSPCTSDTVGACTLQHCAAKYEETTSWASAGTIEISGGEPPITLRGEPKTSHLYEGFLAVYGAPPFRGGESVTVTASGGDVPAFTASLTYPLLLLADVAGTTATNGDRTLPASASSGATLTWTRGAPDVQLVVQGVDTVSPTDAATTSLACQVDSTTGHLDIPASLIARLPSGTELRLFSASRKAVRAGDWDVTIRIAGEVLTSDKHAQVVLVTAP